MGSLVDGISSLFGGGSNQRGQQRDTNSQGAALDQSKNALDKASPYFQQAGGNTLGWLSDALQNQYYGVGRQSGTIGNMNNAVGNEGRPLQYAQQSLGGVPGALNAQSGYLPGIGAAAGQQYGAAGQQAGLAGLQGNEFANNYHNVISAMLGADGFNGQGQGGQGQGHLPGEGFTAPAGGASPGGYAGGGRVGQVAGAGYSAPAGAMMPGGGSGGRLPGDGFTAPAGGASPGGYAGGGRVGQVAGAGYSAPPGGMMPGGGSGGGAAAPAGNGQSAQAGGGSMAYNPNFDPYQTTGNSLISQYSDKVAPQYQNAINSAQHDLLQRGMTGANSIAPAQIAQDRQAQASDVANFGRSVGIQAQQEQYRRLGDAVNMITGAGQGAMGGYGAAGAGYGNAGRSYGEAAGGYGNLAGGYENLARSNQDIASGYGGQASGYGGVNNAQANQNNQYGTNAAGWGDLSNLFGNAGRNYQGLGSAYGGLANSWQGGAQQYMTQGQNQNQNLMGLAQFFGGM